MKDHAWMDPLLNVDSLAPIDYLKGDVVYTVYRTDLENMPGLNFGELSALDSEIRILLN